MNYRNDLIFSLSYYHEKIHRHQPFILIRLYPVRTKTDINIVYIGDSITFGAGLDNAGIQAPPARAGEYLRKQPGIGIVNLSNQGHNGYTTLDFLPGTAAFAAAEIAAKSFYNKPAQLVFSIMLGTNDSAITGPNGSPVLPEAYYKNLKTITGRLLKDFPNCKILLNRPLWYSPNTYNGAKYLQQGLNRLQSYFPLLKKLAGSSTGHIYLGDTLACAYFKAHYLTKLQPENGRQGTFYLHPNKAGAADLGMFWEKAVDRIIEL